MRRWQRVVLILVMMLWGSVSLFTTAIAQEPTDRSQTVAIITTPEDGGVISGSVLIFGSASHPSAFDYFQLEYANLNNPTPIWLPITLQIRQQAPENEVLGIWETVETGIADGLYQIRLRVFLNDTNVEPVTFVVTNLQLVNTAPTPVPTVAGGDVIVQETPDAAPIIEQPPTTVPRIATSLPAASSSSNLVAGTPEDSGSSSINFARLQSAFCTGTIISLAFFGVLLGYISVRARLRPVTRQIMWQIRNEMDDER